MSEASLQPQARQSEAIVQPIQHADESGLASSDTHLGEDQASAAQGSRVIVQEILQHDAEVDSVDQVDVSPQIAQVKQTAAAQPRAASAEHFQHVGEQSVAEEQAGQAGASPESTHVTADAAMVAASQDQAGEPDQSMEDDGQPVRLQQLQGLVPLSCLDTKPLAGVPFHVSAPRTLYTGTGYGCFPQNGIVNTPASFPSSATMTIFFT